MKAKLLAVLVLMAFSVPVYAGNMDGRIESSARQSYVFKTYLKNDDIKIVSSDGAVTLSGTVSEDSHKSLAQETVASLPGVKSVENKLEVKGESPPEKSDAWITAKVKTALLFHRNVSTLTEVSTKDGVVTLHGDAASMAQKDLTTEYVRDVEGVRYVKNDMTVTKDAPLLQTAGENIDDASITALVKMALLYHRSTSALNTSVTTDKGEVTLTGKARNEAEKDLAAKLASDVSGVKGVKNLMSVE
jgi:hyperosmotically inducible periplasmic protein